MLQLQLLRPMPDQGKSSEEAPSLEASNHGMYLSPISFMDSIQTGVTKLTLTSCKYTFSFISQIKS